MSSVDTGLVTSVVCADAWIERGKDGRRGDDNAANGASVPPYSDQKHGAKSAAYDQSKYMNLRQKYNRRTIEDLGRPKREAARSMCRPLKQWLYAHRDLPYPTKADKLQLASVARMTVVQVSNWFANARRRLKKTVSSAVELSWERRFKLYNRNVVGNQERLSISSDDEDDDDDDDREMMMEQAAAGEFTSGNDDAESCDGAVSCSTSGQPSSSSSSSSSTTSGNSSGEEKDGAAPTPPGKQRCANNNRSDGHPLLLLPGKFKQGILHRYLSDAVGLSYVIESNDDVSDSSKMSGSPSSRDSALSASCRSTPTGDRQYEEIFFERAAARLSGCDPGHGESDEYDLESLEISAVHTLASLAAASNRNSLSKPTRNNTQRKQQQQQQQQQQQK